jgi:ribose transport system permease protein
MSKTTLGRTETMSQDLAHSGSVPERVESTKRRVILSSRAGAILSRSGIIITWIAAIALFAILRTDAFLTIDNGLSMLKQASLVAIVAAGVTVPLIMHEFDLSAAAILGLSGAVATVFMADHGMHWLIALALTLLLCGSVGGAQGLLISRFPGSSFIVTLGSASILAGIEFYSTNGNVVFENIPSSFLYLGTGKLAGWLHAQIVVMVLVIALLGLLITQTQFGRNVYAIGGNRKAAVAAGIRVGRFVTIAFVISAVLAGLGGAILTAQASAYFPGGASGYLLPIFTATFLGAAIVGHFSVIASAFGAFYLTVLTTGFAMLGVSEWVTELVQGGLLLFALGLARLGGESTQISPVGGH